MLVLSNLIYERNKYIGSMAFDTETKRGRVYTAKELSNTTVWGKENGKLIGYKNLPMLNRDTGNWTYANHITVLGRAIQNKQTLYLVMDGNGTMGQLSDYDMLYSASQGVCTNLIKSDKVVRSRSGSLPQLSILRKKKVEKGEQPAVSTVEYLSRLKNEGGSLGVNKKFIGGRVSDGRIGVVKFPFNNESKDCINEVVAYELGKLFGVRVCEASLEKYKGKECIISLFEYDYDGGENIRSCKQVFGIDGFRKNFNKNGIIVKVGEEAFVDFERMVLFDLITHQTDRHISNFAFYKNNLYSLYDNGRCLFNGENIEYIEAVDVISELYLNEHGFGFTYFDIAGTDYCSKLLNRNISYQEIFSVVRKYYTRKEAVILSKYMKRVYDLLTGTN